MNKHYRDDEHFCSDCFERAETEWEQSLGYDDLSEIYWEYRKTCKDGETE